MLHGVVVALPTWRRQGGKGQLQSDHFLIQKRGRPYRLGDASLEGSLGLGVERRFGVTDKN